MPNVLRGKIFHKRNTQCDLALAVLLRSRVLATIVVSPFPHPVRASSIAPDTQTLTRSPA